MNPAKLHSQAQPGKPPANRSQETQNRGTSHSSSQSQVQQHALTPSTQSTRNWLRCPFCSYDQASDRQEARNRREEKWSKRVFSTYTSWREHIVRTHSRARNCEPCGRRYSGGIGKYQQSLQQFQEEHKDCTAGRPRFKNGNVGSMLRIMTPAQQETLDDHKFHNSGLKSQEVEKAKGMTLELFQDLKYTYGYGSVDRRSHEQSRQADNSRSRNVARPLAAKPETAHPADVHAPPRRQRIGPDRSVGVPPNAVVGRSTSDFAVPQAPTRSGAVPANTPSHPLFLGSRSSRPTPHRASGPVGGVTTSRQGQPLQRSNSAAPQAATLRHHSHLYMQPVPKPPTHQDDLESYNLDPQTPSALRTAYEPADPETSTHRPNTVNDVYRICQPLHASHAIAKASNDSGYETLDYPGGRYGYNTSRPWTKEELEEDPVFFNNQEQASVVAQQGLEASLFLTDLHVPGSGATGVGLGLGANSGGDNNLNAIGSLFRHQTDEDFDRDEMLDILATNDSQGLFTETAINCFGRDPLGPGIVPSMESSDSEATKR